MAAAAPSSAPTPAAVGGVLAPERATATFDTKALTTQLHGPQHEMKLKFESLFSSNPLFDRTNDVFLSRPEYTKLCIKRSFETYRIVKQNKDFLAAHSPLHGEGGFYVGQFGTPSGLTDHFSLFLMTILSQGTKEQQREWIMKAANLQIIGTYAQTELGHGSNIRGLETTAHYDAATDEFVLNSNGVTGTKWWPGALGLLATHALLYARLIVGDKDYGFHAFVVQIRNENHEPMPGVEVGDLGPKLGYSAYDSGFLNVKDVRVPRFNMLARFQQLEKGGKYTKAPPNLAKIAYLTMMKIRVAICASAAGALAKSLTIAVRYTAHRTQGFINAKKSRDEKKIIDHRILQSRLFPLIGTAYALWFASSQVHKLLIGFDMALKAKGAEVDTSVLPLLHATAAGLKAFSTQIAVLGMDEARKCCGGHGYTMSSGLGGHYLTYLPAITYEGDIVPMALQCARFLMNSYGALKKGKKLFGPAAYLAASDSNLPSSVDDFRDLDKLQALYEAAGRRATATLAMAMYKETTANKKNFDDAWNECHIVAMRAAYTHTLAFIVTQFNQAVKDTKDAKIQAVLRQLCALFAITRITELSVRDHQLAPKAVHNSQRAMTQLLKEVRPNAVSLVDAFGYTDFQLCSTIGSYDNSDMYEKMVASARANPLNKPEYLRTFHSEILSGFLSKEYLSKAKL